MSCTIWLGTTGNVRRYRKKHMHISVICIDVYICYTAIHIYIHIHVVYAYLYLFLSLCPYPNLHLYQLYTVVKSISVNIYQGPKIPSIKTLDLFRLLGDYLIRGYINPLQVPGCDPHLDRLALGQSTGFAPCDQAAKLRFGKKHLCDRVDQLPWHFHIIGDKQLINPIT